jgi:hypothetical protein
MVSKIPAGMILFLMFVFSGTVYGADDYVTIKDGHLNYQGKRLRIWSSMGNFIAADYAHIDAEVRRFADLGFNGYRTSTWWDIDIDKWTYKKGDKSLPDLRDYLLASLRKQGIWVWSDMLNSALVRPEHVDLVNDPATRAEWLKALGDKPLNRWYAVVWDKRAEGGYIREIKKMLNHVNQHTGLRWADDPMFFVWEMENEQWWLQRILNYADHLSMPKFFQDELVRLWNEWLKKRYGTTERLHDAWIGSLLPGESLEKSTVQLLPLNCPTGGAAEALGIDAKNFKGLKFTFHDFSKRRGGDVIEFLADLLLAHKKRVYAAMRSAGKPGIGISVVPIVFDTGYSFSPASIYVNGFGDALCVGTFITQITLDPKHPRYPFKSILEESPSLSYGDPWVEQNRLVDKPTFIYENNIFRPDKYRCEYPYLLVALGAIQDWDVVDFAYYGHPVADILTSTQPFNKPLFPDNGSYWQGITFKTDEAMVSAMRVAGELFKNFALQPPKQPTVITVGRDVLWDMDYFEWGDISKIFAPTVYRYGLRLKFDPMLSDKVIVSGPLVHGREFLPPQVEPTDQIHLNWQKGILRIDSPQAKAAAGFLPDRVSFKDGIEIYDFNIHIPKDLPYYKPNEDRYVCFGLTSTDGQELAKSKKIIMSAMCGSFNTGMKMDLVNWPKGNQYDRMQDFVECPKMCAQYGTLPVLMARVGFTLKAPVLSGHRYTLKDWHLKPLGAGTIGSDGLLTIRNSQPVFLVEFEKGP